MRLGLLCCAMSTVSLLGAVARAESRVEASLDGSWDIVFDHQNEGRAAGWTLDERFPRDRARPIEVPSCWELIERDYEGVAFYRRVFRTPAEWKGRVVRLRFDAVNFRAEVWLNGTAVGSHEGGFTPFEMRVDDLLEPDAENVLIVRVVGPILLSDRVIDGMGPMETPQWRAAIVGGIWQSVRLIATGEAYVRDVFVEPRVTERSAAFRVEVAHEGRESVESEVEITVRSARAPETIAARIRKGLRLDPGRNELALKTRIESARLWSPDDPHLYRAEVRVVLDEEESDRWSTRFGLREFTIAGGRFVLNGEPIYLKATFFEGLYPVRLAVPDSREMAAREIRLAKEAGFDMIRPWRRPPAPEWLDLADEMGVLTVGSFAIECMDLPVESASLPAWVESEIRESILRDRNRACVVQWELFNELKRPVLKRLLEPMSRLARELDPTRLILDESGGWARGASLYLPYGLEPVKFNDIHDYPGPQVDDGVYEKLRLAGSISHEEMRAGGLRGRLPGRNVVPGLMTWFSELGYGSLPDLVANNEAFARLGDSLAPAAVYHRRLADEHREALRESGLDEIYPDLSGFCREQQLLHGIANQRMIEAVRCNPLVAGYCVHALTAGNWIVGAGLLDLFRDPKPEVYERTKAASRPRILSIRVRPRNVYAERGARLEVTAVNDLEAVPGRVRIRALGADGKVVTIREQETLLESGITSLLSDTLDTTGLAGPYVIEALVLSPDGAVVAESRYPFEVFPAELLEPPGERVAVLDPTRSLTPYLTRSAIGFEAFSERIDPRLPVLVSRTVAANPRQRADFSELERFVRAGGTAVYLQGGGSQAPFGRAGPSSPLLPVSARLKQAVGTWNGVSHVVRDHPIFEGLPTGRMMGALYENVWAPTTLLGVGGELVVGAIGYDWYPDYDLRRRHYVGPGETWWGADLAVVPLEKGRCVVSQLRIVENLGEDPVADRLLHNLIRFAAKR